MFAALPISVQDRFAHLRGCNLDSEDVISSRRARFTCQMTNQNSITQMFGTCLFPKILRLQDFQLDLHVHGFHVKLQTLSQSYLEHTYLLILRLQIFLDLSSMVKVGIKSRQVLLETSLCIILQLLEVKLPVSVCNECNLDYMEKLLRVTIVVEILTRMQQSEI